MNAGPQPFFLKADPGQRFCLLHEPANNAPRRGAVVYVHPFAEELNKTRRMAALQARALSERGFTVLQIDLYGCGDSSGDFVDPRWSDWRKDVGSACDHVLVHSPRPLILWGLRLGALLAVDYAAAASVRPDALLLWQPVLNGEAHLRQFFRQQSAARLLTPGLDKATAEQATEVGGYALSPGLQSDVRAIDMHALAPGCPVFWIEQAGPSSIDLPPASNDLIQRWNGTGVRVNTAVAAGPQFWATSEISESPSFLAATGNFLAQTGLSQ